MCKPTRRSQDGWMDGWMDGLGRSGGWGEKVRLQARRRRNPHRVGEVAGAKVGRKLHRPRRQHCDYLHGVAVVAVFA
eukprot:361150-Chlamydomonas_euryale.AAC.4